MKYKLFFHTYNKELESSIKVNSGLSYFYRKINRKVYHQTDAVDFVKKTHKEGDIEKLFKIPQDIYDSESKYIGATSLTILKCWIG